MALSLADVQQWQPEQVDEVASAAAQRARTSGGTAEELRNLAVFDEWKGDAGDAARRAVENSATTLSASAKEAFLVSLGAQKSATDIRAVKNDLQSILDDAAAAPAVQIDLAANTVTPPDTTGWSEGDVKNLSEKIADLENRIVAVLAAAEEADGDLARILTAATGGDPETPAEAGAADANSLQDGHLTPEESARLAENTTLTPEQQAALKRGDLVLPASQMEYLNKLARSLDGKSSHEIRTLMDSLGTDGARLQDALQLVSNEHVSAAGVDPSLKPGDAGYVPARGGFDNLPDVMRRDLTKYPLEWKHDPAVGAYPTARPELIDLAGIVAKGDPALQQGSSLDAHMLKQSEVMLNETANVPKENLPFVKGQVDPVLQQMLSVAGRDQFALHDALAGADGQKPNDKFIQNLMSHQWADNGAAVAGLLNGTAPVANVADPTDPTQIAEATRAGQTMHAVDYWVGTHPTQMLDIPGAEKQSLGQVNPDIARALASANVPYLDDMLGNKLDDTRGFGPLDSLTNAEMPVMRDLMAVIDTDKQAAGTLNAQAFLNGIEYQNNFEQSVVKGETIDVADLHSAGTMRGVIETAANIADNDAIAYGNYEAVEAHKSRGEWLDLAKKAGGQIPVVREFLDSIGRLPGDPLKDIFVGDAPIAKPGEYPSITSSEPLQYTVAQNLLDHNIGTRDAFTEYGLVDEGSGRLVAMNNDNMEDYRNAFTEYFKGLDPAVMSGIGDFEDGHRDAFPKPPGHTG